MNNIKDTNNKKDILILLLLIIINVIFFLLEIKLKVKMYHIPIIILSILSVLKFSEIISKWNQLARLYSINFKKYRQLRKEVINHSIIINNIRYILISKIYYTKEGIIIRLIWILSFFHKILLIPWDKIEEFKISDQILNFNDFSNEMTKNILKPTMNLIYNINNDKINFVLLKAEKFENLIIKLPWNDQLKEYIKKVKLK